MKENKEDNIKYIGECGCYSDDFMGFECNGESKVEEIDVNGIKKIWRVTCERCGHIAVLEKKPYIR